MENVEFRFAKKCFWEGNSLKFTQPVAPFTTDGIPSLKLFWTNMGNTLSPLWPYLTDSFFRFPPNSLQLLSKNKWKCWSWPKHWGNIHASHPTVRGSITSFYVCSQRPSHYLIACSCCSSSPFGSIPHLNQVKIFGLTWSLSPRPIHEPSFYSCTFSLFKPNLT